MKIDLSNFESSNSSLFDISIIQNDVGGGVTSKKEIDSIQNYPEAKSLIISGLTQVTFEYLIERYGHQFEAITFWKNKQINNLTALSHLKDIKYIHFFFNQKVTALWNMTNNIHLKGLAIYDFSRLNKIDEIITATNLEYLSLGNKVWSKMKLESFRPLIKSSVIHFSWWGDKVLDNDYMCLTKSNIHELDMSIMHFKLNELARLIAGFTDLNGQITIPYIESSIIKEGETTTKYFLCKGKKSLIKGIDDSKLEKYLLEFNDLVRKYKSEQL